jgi:hypothetical protein
MGSVALKVSERLPPAEKIKRSWKNGQKRIKNEMK